MEANKLVEKFRNSSKDENDWKEVLNYCLNNFEKLNLTNEEDKYLLDNAIKYLMIRKFKCLENTEAKLLTVYFAKKYLKEHGIYDDVQVKIIENDEYRELSQNESLGFCVSRGNGKSEVVYSEKLLEAIKSKEVVEKIMGLKAVFHEVVHARQNKRLYSPEEENSNYNGNVYRFALETLTRKVEPKFYDENYLQLLKEYQAEYLGVQEAVNILDYYQIIDKNKINDVHEFIIELLTVDEKNYFSEGDKANFRGGNFDATIVLSCSTDKYVSEIPGVIEEIPVLKYAYNLDGSRKDIIQLIKERANLISENSDVDFEIVNDLYRTIANYKSIDKDEVLTLWDYIEENGTDDEFVYELMEFRLKKIGMSPESISETMQNFRNISAQMQSQDKEANNGKNNVTI